MGQAKQRGTRDQRVAEALERAAIEQAAKAEALRKRRAEHQQMVEEARLKREAAGLPPIVVGASRSRVRGVATMLAAAALASIVNLK